MKRWIGTSLVGMGLVLALGVTSADAQKEKKVKRDTYLITADEIAEKADVTNAEEAIKRLRPQWLRASRAKGGLGAAAFGSQSSRPNSVGKTAGSEDNPGGTLDGASVSANSKRDQMMAAEAGKTGGPVLYVDDVKQPTLDDLRNIRVAEIAEIRFMTGNQATSRYGDGHAAGAILLKTNRLGG